MMTRASLPLSGDASQAQAGIPVKCLGCLTVRETPSESVNEFSLLLSKGEKTSH